MLNLTPMNLVGKGYNSRYFIYHYFVHRRLTVAKSFSFKMHLRPVGMQLNTNGLELEDVPPGISAERIMGDYLKYLFAETETFIKDSHTDGIDIWREVQGRISFVLSHPNGWTGICQQKMRKSAILGKLVPDTEEGRRRVIFITEGEASALACLSGGLGPSKLAVRSDLCIASPVSQVLMFSSLDFSSL